ncbi:MAG: hypothetical protein HQL12_01615 [Candidatus Omnitrophica bacterium]|nr:hypothetical protein [Candidatus Omnitrophota bacterium]
MDILKDLIAFNATMRELNNAIRNGDVVLQDKVANYIEQAFDNGLGEVLDELMNVETFLKNGKLPESRNVPLVAAIEDNPKVLFSPDELKTFDRPDMKPGEVIDFVIGTLSRLKGTAEFSKNFERPTVDGLFVSELVNQVQEVIEKISGKEDAPYPNLSVRLRDALDLLLITIANNPDISKKEVGSPDLAMRANTLDEEKFIEGIKGTIEKSLGIVPKESAGEFQSALESVKPGETTLEEFRNTINALWTKSAKIDFSKEPSSDELKDVQLKNALMSMLAAQAEEINKKLGAKSEPKSIKEVPPNVKKVIGDSLGTLVGLYDRYKMLGSTENYLPKELANIRQFVQQGIMGTDDVLARLTDTLNNIKGKQGKFFARDREDDAGPIAVMEALNQAIEKIGAAAGQEMKKSSQTVTADMVEESKTKEGGIDLNAANLNLNIKRDGNGVPLPVSQQNLENIKLDGLTPVILDIKPAINSPLLSQLQVAGA